MGKPPGGNKTKFLTLLDAISKIACVRRHVGFWRMHTFCTFSRPLISPCMPAPWRCHPGAESQMPIPAHSSRLRNFSGVEFGRGLWRRILNRF